MTIDAWLRTAIADAEQRRLPELKPLLEDLALATRALRAVNSNPDAGTTHIKRARPAADTGSAGPAVHLDRPSR